MGGQRSQQVMGLISAQPFSGLCFSWCLLCWFPVTHLRHFNEASFVPSTCITICYYGNGSTDQAQQGSEPPPVASVSGKHWEELLSKGREMVAWATVLCSM